MGILPVDLYRWGKTGPRLDRVRIAPDALTRGVDAVSFDAAVEGGHVEIWVKARQKGVSSFAAPHSRMQGQGRWWVIPRNTIYDDALLFVYNSHGTIGVGRPRSICRCQATLKPLRS